MTFEEILKFLDDKEYGGENGFLTFDTKTY